MAEPIIWDARKMIGGPWWPCPKCGRQDLGTSMISNGFITRRCRYCLHTVAERLPPPRRRRVVYLDQFVFSNMAKSLDPVWRAERGPQAVIWTRLFDALDSALKLHLITCPESRLHEQESVVHPHYEMLERLYGHFSAETSFEFPTMIHHRQLHAALTAKLAGQAPNFGIIAPEHVISGSLAEWTDRLNIRVNLSATLVDRDATRDQRNRSGAAFAAIFERWGHEKLDFETVYRSERRGLADAMVQRYLEYEALFRRASAGQVPVTEELWNPSLQVDVVRGLIGRAAEAGLSGPDARRVGIGFLYTEEALSAPMNEISSLLMAGLARRAANGQKRAPSRGMWNDITAISAFLPYCDAMFVDNECAELLREEPTRSRLAAYPTHLFSTKTAEEFLVYLADLEAEAGPAWREQVERIYGPEWLSPFRTILEQERERRARAHARTTAESNTPPASPIGRGR